MAVRLSVPKATVHGADVAEDEATVAVVNGTLTVRRDRVNVFVRSGVVAIDPITPRRSWRVVLDNGDAFVVVKQRGCACGG